MTITSKDGIKRKMMSHSMLKRVIMRADFSSMLSLERTVTMLNDEKWFKGTFLNYEKRELKTNKDERTEIEDEDLEGSVVKRFDDCNIAPERNITLDISSKFVTMLINCDSKYEMIDDYLDLFVKVVAFIVHNDDYVKLNRLAIRKTDGMEFNCGEDADEVFEYFDQNIADHQQDLFYFRTYTDSFIYGKSNVNVNYNRTVKILGNGKYVFVLDIDTFLDNERINKNRPTEAELCDTFVNKLNESSFELFKRGVKLDYLKTIVKKEYGGAQ